MFSFLTIIVINKSTITKQHWYMCVFSYETIVLLKLNDLFDNFHAKKKRIKQALQDYEQMFIYTPKINQKYCWEMKQKAKDSKWNFIKQYYNWVEHWADVYHPFLHLSSYQHTNNNVRFDRIEQTNTNHWHRIPIYI